MAKWIVTIVEDNEDARYIDTIVKDTFDEARDVADREIERLNFYGIAVRVRQVGDDDEEYEARADAFCLMWWMTLLKMIDDRTGITTDFEW